MQLWANIGKFSLGMCRDSQIEDKYAVTLLFDQIYFHLVDDETQAAPLRYSLDCKHLVAVWCVVSCAPVFCHRNPSRMEIEEVDEEISVNPYETAFDPYSLAPSQDPEGRGNLKKIHLKEILDSVCLFLSRWEHCVML